MPNMPFTVDPPPSPIDPVQNAAVEARRKFESDKKAYYASSLIEASNAFAEYESNRKAKFIRSWMADNFVPIQWPYDGYSNEDLYRISLPYESRIETLLKAGLLGQALQCFLARAGGKSELANVRKFLAPWIPTTGTKAIEVTEDERIGLQNAGHTVFPAHATDLSPELFDVLRTYGIRVRRGVVRFTTGQPEPSEW